MNPVGIFGGTFDPVHYGHLRTAIEIVEHFKLSELRILPCGTPPLKQAARASSQQRMRMLELAFNGQPDIKIDTTEINREGPSYTIDTLTTIRKSLKEVPIILFLGTDTLPTINQWHRWEELLDLAHLVFITRPGWELNAIESDNKLPAVVKQLILENEVKDIDKLYAIDAGNILMFPTRQLNISSSDIRSMVQNNKSTQFLLPDNVIHYIETENLYL